MQLPEGTHLAYTVLHEAWYAAAIRRADRPTIMVHAAFQGGGSAWEFAVEDHSRQTDQGILRLEMFTDSWQALTQVPELFKALADEPVDTLDALRELLDSLGAVDVTSRESPYQERS